MFGQALRSAIKKSPDVAPEALYNGREVHPPAPLWRGTKADPENLPCRLTARIGMIEPGIKSALLTGADNGPPKTRIMPTSERP